MSQWKAKKRATQRKPRGWKEREVASRLTALRVIQSLDEMSCCVCLAPMAGRTGNVGVFLPDAEPGRCIGYVMCHACGIAPPVDIERRLAERPGMPLFLEGGARGEAERARTEAVFIADRNADLIRHLLAKAQARGVVDPVVLLLSDRNAGSFAGVWPRAEAADLLLKVRPRAVKVAKRLRETQPLGTNWIVIDSPSTDHTVSVMLLPALPAMGGAA